MKRSGFTLIEAMVLVAVVAGIAGLGGVIIYPIYAKDAAYSRLSTCQSNLKQMGLALAQYNQDYGDKTIYVASNDVSSSVEPFPRPYGWADALRPYLKNTSIYQCPGEADTKAGQDATQLGFTDYFYNSNLSGRRWQGENPLLTITFSEGNDGTDRTDARYNRSSLPKSWFKDESKPLFRHLQGANFVFVDGHVKFYHHRNIDQMRKPNANTPTFKIR